MKILELTIHNFRGIVNMPTLSVSGQNVVVYGRNGVGKSAVADAIDFLLSGVISRLAGEGTKEVSVKKHGPHVGKSPEDSYVMAKLQTASGCIFDVKRSVSNPNNIEIEDEFREIFSEIENYAKNGAHFLSRRELLKYVIAPANKRAEQIQNLLDIPDLKKKADYLSKSLKETQKRKEENERILNETNDMIVGICGELTLIEAVNQWRNILGANELNICSADTVLSDVECLEDVDDDKRNMLMHNFNALISEISDTAEKIILADSSIKLDVLELSNSEMSVSEIRKLSLISMGIDLVGDDGKCPLCDSQWDDSNSLRDYLCDKKTKGEQISLLLERYKKNLSYINNNLGKVKSLLTNIELTEEEQQQNKLLTYAKKLFEKNSLLSSLTEYDEYINQSSEIISDINSLDWDAIVNECKSIVSQLMSSIDEKERLKKEAYDNLKRICNLLNQKLIYEERNKKSLELYELMAKVNSAYDAAQTEVLNNIYDEIKDRFVDIYKQLHGEDESNFMANMERSQNGIGLTVDFHEQGQFPPTAYHSEGHQDSMGIALFFALMEHMSSTEKGLVVLDDVVMSVDIEHRLRFCDLLRDSYPDYQFFITTHDEIWEKYLEKHGVVQKKNAFNFINWTVETGPIMMTKENIWEECSRRAETDLNSAAHYLRREMENYFEEVCDLLGASLKYNSEHKWDFGQYYSAANKKLSDLYKKARATAKKYNNTSLMENVAICEQELSVSRVDVDNNNWITNRLVHKNDEVFSMNEYEAALTSLKKYCSCFECDICGSKYQVAYGGNFQPSVLQCKCGKRMLPLWEK